ncbi:hypothetical protein CLOM_g120 [Closterium sp. NIES-68]|nr:hypothetical protein CLOM_g16793 [Closterium sp. NIES-68]GJP40444.1 hypothetical protein CLOM_g120 [Closterium sp. NIES-68]GJP75586.1 hypothetical protein CLOP_g6016 [Closterium sp. NIES-67]
MDQDQALRRLQVYGRHIAPAYSTPPETTDNEAVYSESQLNFQPCSSSSNSSVNGGATGVYASATGKPSKYALMHGAVSSAPVAWQPGRIEGPPLQDVLYETAVGEGIAKITINRPERRNAFRPETVKELKRAFDAARDDVTVGVIIFTGKGDLSFCSGGDQAVRGKHGYVGGDQVPRLNVLDLQVQIRRTPKPVIAMVAGYAIGGGHVLHLVCDITIAADNAVFGQTGPKVGSFDAGYGCSIMSRLVGPKKAREIWFLARHYTAAQALDMGLVNTVVPLANLEGETVKWCREILRNSPTALRVLKSAINAVDDGTAGLQELAGNATLIFYNTPEAVEGRESYLNGRAPDFSKFPKLP